MYSEAQGWGRWGGWLLWLHLDPPFSISVYENSAPCFCEDRQTIEVRRGQEGARTEKCSQGLTPGGSPTRHKMK